MKKVTSVDVAREAGVSQSTVSAVFSPNDKIRVSKETRDRVLRIAWNLGYSAQIKANEKTDDNFVAVFVPSLVNPFYSMIVNHLSKTLYKNQMEIGLYCTHKSDSLETELLQKISEKTINKIIYTFTPSDTKVISELGKKATIVIIGEGDRENCVTIALNSFNAGYMVAERLYMLGHTKIAFASDNIDQVSKSRKLRLEGIKAFLSQKKLLKQFIQLTSNDDTCERGDLQVGYTLVNSLLKSGTIPSAIIGVNDITALGIINAIHDNGYAVPNDISVVGFDNIEMSGSFSPSLTTIDHCIEARVHQAVDILLYGASTNRITYEPQLLIRQSVRKL